MKSIAIRDLRSRPRQVRKIIATEPHSLLTANGKPFALVIPVDGDTLDDTVDALKIGRAQTALRALRSEARQGGRDEMTVAEIDAVIAKGRRQRSARGSRTAAR